MRTRRFENGALQLNQVKPTFTLSEETGSPIGVAPFIVRPANRLVEEWMLAANESVALVLASNLPKTAFLRRHPPPTGKQLKDACALLRCCNVDVDITSAHSIQVSFFSMISVPLSGASSFYGLKANTSFNVLCVVLIQILRLRSTGHVLKACG